MTADKAYGLGKSIAPLQEGLISIGWNVTYLSQSSLSEQEMIRKNRLVQRFQGLLFTNRFNYDALVEALVERFFIGNKAAQMQHDLSVTHVHLHDPWLAMGFLIGRAWLRIKSHLSKDSSQDSRQYLEASQPTQLRTRVGITEHGFGAYFQAVRLDGVHMSQFAQKVLLLLERFICAQMDWVIAPTQLALDRLAIDLGFRRTEDKLVVQDSPCGKVQSIPVNWFTVLHNLPEVRFFEREEARQKIGVPKTSKLILSVGRLAPLKQFDVIINMFAQLQQEFDDLYLVILGGGDQAELERQAIDLGVLKQLSIVFSNEVDLYYSAADVYISASLSESFGLANLEALAHGLPCVCSSVGGVPEVVQEGAILVLPERDDLLAALRELLADEEIARTWSERAKSRLKRWPKCAEITHSYVQIYQ